MTRVLYVGDLHVVPSELEDCRKVIELVGELILTQRPNWVVFLGDLYHHHGLVYLEVMDFWAESLKYLAGLTPWTNILLMVGNHDRPGPGAKPGLNALMSHKFRHDNVHVADIPSVWYDHVLVVPYMDDPQAFVEVCQQSSARTLVCHQTFMGAIYENGFQVTTGNIEQNLLPQKEIISGHIHRPQKFDKVWYLGAPRWRTASDANTERNLWLVVHGDDGGFSQTYGFSTGAVCRQIFDLEDSLEAPISHALYNARKDDVRVTVRGSSEYLRERKLILEAVGVKVRTVKTDVAPARVRESQGINAAFQAYFQSFTPKHETPKPVLEKLVEERLSV
jgi:DNA repair exonuclease SbcCD nuclease subunit